jgi:flagellar assembly factor FliW
MIVETSRFGPLSIQPDQLIIFVDPILGFGHLSQFILLDHAEESPFQWLQSVEQPDLAFVVTMPRLFNLNYQFTLEDWALERLQFEAHRWSDLSANELLVLTMVTIPEQNPTAMTTNLLGPIVINVDKRLAGQVVLADTRLSTKVPLLPSTVTSKQNVTSPVTEQQTTVFTI